jgi:hypothetical protein
MAKKTSVTSAETSVEAPAVAAPAEVVEETKAPEPEVKPLTTGVIKTYVQNGLRYQRIRNEDGSTYDVRA